MIYRVKRELNPNIYKFCRFTTETICKLNSNLSKKQKTDNKVNKKIKHFYYIKLYIIKKG
jgi:hypothetical protein